VTSGGAANTRARKWIHKAYRVGQQSQHHNPLLDLVIPLERMLQAPDAAVPAFESLLDSVDPWVRAWPGCSSARCGSCSARAAGMRTLSGDGAREFRALGERFGISLALTELAERIAMRGEFAGACEYYEQAIAVVTEVGAIEDVIRLRTRQALLYWLTAIEDASAAAIAEAERCAEGVTWPDALVELALAKAELARWGGDAEEATTNSASRQPCWATTRSRRTSARDTRPARLPGRRSQRSPYATA
jgi:hypothetical protein